MIQTGIRLTIAAALGTVTSLAVFVVFELVASFLSSGSLPPTALEYSTFFVFFFAGLPVLGFAVCGGIPLFLILRDRPIRVARTLFLGSGMAAGAVVVPAGWYHFWASFDMFFAFLGAVAGAIGAYTFWQIGSGAPRN